jgi:amidase
MTDPWLKTSIMAIRGLANGVAGARHEFTIEKQGAFHYVYGPYAKSVLTIDPGDVVVVETEGAFGGVITSEQDSPSARLVFPFLNPQCGPIAVNGIENGDCLAVHIHAVETRGAQPAGKTCIIPEFGGLVGTASTALLNPPLPERVRVMHVDKDGVRWSDKITLPYQPFIGTLGISPRSRRSRRCSRIITAAIWTCLTSRPARSCTFPYMSKVVFSMSAIAMQPRATANCRG